jgi:two-component system sensor histidine kinase UhpB
MRKRVAGLPLFWRVFLTDAVVLAVAVALLAIAPVTVSAPVALTELLVLVAGMVALLVLHFLLLRPAMLPLLALQAAMRIDPMQPGRRVPVAGGPELASLAETFNDMLDRLEDERRDSGRRALLAQESERRRVARAIHDGIGQIFTAMMLQIEGFAPKIAPELREQLDELRETARAGAQEVRRVSARLRPEALEDLGLQSALSALATSFGNQAGLDIERRLERALPLSEEQELVIYRVAQEALTNVARHAGARRAELTLGRADGDVVLRVADDGRGLPPHAGSSSNGIRGMRERAILIGAELAIDQVADGGTEVVLRVPVQA